MTNDFVVAYTYDSRIRSWDRHSVRRHLQIADDKKPGV